MPTIQELEESYDKLRERIDQISNNINYCTKESDFNSCGKLMKKREVLVKESEVIKKEIIKKTKESKMK